MEEQEQPDQEQPENPTWRRTKSAVSYIADKSQTYLQSSAKAAVQFESAFTKLTKNLQFEGSTDQARSENIANFQQEIKALSDTTGISKSDILKILKTGSDEGIKTQDLIGFAENAIKVHIATDGDLTQVSQKLAATRTSLNLSKGDSLQLANFTEYLGDQIQGVNGADIRTVLSKEGESAKDAGFDNRQAGALTASLLETGAKTEVAAQTLKTITKVLTAGNDQTDIQAKAWEALNLDPEKIAQGMKTDATATLKQFFDRINSQDKTTDEKNTIISQLFGTKADDKVTATLGKLIKNQGDDTKGLSQTLALTTDTKASKTSLDDKYQAQTQTYQHRLQRLQNTQNNMQMAVGSSLLVGLLPIVEDLAPKIEAFAGAVSQFMAAHPEKIANGLVLLAGGIALTKTFQAGKNVYDGVKSWWQGSDDSGSGGDTATPSFNALNSTIKRTQQSLKGLNRQLQTFASRTRRIPLNGKCCCDHPTKDRNRQRKRHRHRNTRLHTRQRRAFQRYPIPQSNRLPRSSTAPTPNRPLARLQQAEQNILRSRALQASRGRLGRVLSVGGKLASRIAGPLTAAIGAVNVVSALAKGDTKEAAEQGGSALGGLGGAAAGAAIGTAILPGIGTLIGSGIGALAGSELGKNAGNWLHQQWGSWFGKDKTQQPPPESVASDVKAIQWSSVGSHPSTSSTENKTGNNQPSIVLNLQVDASNTNDPQKTGQTIAEVLMPRFEQSLLSACNRWEQQQAASLSDAPA